MTSLQGSFSVPAPFKALVTITCSTLALSHPLGVAVIFFSTFLSPLNYQLQTLSICGTINTKNERCANVLILKIFIIYAVVTILVFLKNTYRKYHVNYLRNTYRENLLNNQNAKNYELLIPFTNVFEHAHMSDYRYDLEDYIIKGKYPYKFEDLLNKAFYHYSYNAKHCFSWFFRIPLPRITSITKHISNKVLQPFVFVFTVILDYLICLSLDKYGLGEKILNFLVSFLKKLF